MNYSLRPESFLDDHEKVKRAHLDKEVLAGLREVGGGDTSFIAGLVGLYRRQFEQKTMEIESAASSGQLAKVAACLHIIKSSSGNLGALRFHEYCAELERIAMSGDKLELDKLLPEFFACYSAVLEEINQAFAPELEASN